MELTNVFRLMADETRFRIMVLLKQSELCVCQLSGILGLSQPKVSKHLARLRDSSIVIVDRRERFVYYSLKNEGSIVDKWIDDIIFNIQDFPQLSADQRMLEARDLYIENCVPIQTKQKKEAL